MKGCDIHMSLSREELLNWAKNRVVFGEGLDILKNDCEIIVFMLEHCEIKIPEQNRFFVLVLKINRKLSISSL